MLIYALMMDAEGQKYIKNNASPKDLSADLHSLEVTLYLDDKKYL
jgi:hypothetical protein